MPGKIVWLERAQQRTTTFFPQDAVPVVRPTRRRRPPAYFPNGGAFFLPNGFRVMDQKAKKSLYERINTPTLGSNLFLIGLALVILITTGTMIALVR